MNILAIDTSTDICSVAVLRDGEILEETSRKVKAGHSGTILNLIDNVLGKSGLKKQDIGLIATGLGPGSFTGIRIGIATAKGLAAALNCEIRGVITLDAVAANAPDADMNIMPVLDARKGEIFCALYDKNRHRISPRVNIEPSQVTDMISNPTLFIGNAIALYDEVFSNSLGSLYQAADKDLWYPRAAVIGRLALNPAFAVNDINPVYIRASDATLLLKRISPEI
jgi:tRNA threonylcarbamoyladenosine biosynthesis protein TsaB